MSLINTNFRILDERRGGCSQDVSDNIMKYIAIIILTITLIFQLINQNFEKREWIKSRLKMDGTILATNLSEVSKKKSIWKRVDLYARATEEKLNSSNCFFTLLKLNSDLVDSLNMYCGDEVDWLSINYAVVDTAKGRFRIYSHEGFLVQHIEICEKSALLWDGMSVIENHCLNEMINLTMINPVTQEKKVLMKDESI